MAARRFHGDRVVAGRDLIELKLAGAIDHSIPRPHGLVRPQRVYEGVISEPLDETPSRIGSEASITVVAGQRTKVKLVSPQ